MNLGAGNCPLDGWENYDIKTGQPCFPLAHADGTVDEIRASHVLEHLSFRDATAALRDWFRALKPGGRLWVAVPDVDKALTADNGKRLFYLMGGRLTSTTSTAARTTWNGWRHCWRTWDFSR